MVISGVEVAGKSCVIKGVEILGVGFTKKISPNGEQAVKITIGINSNNQIVYFSGYIYSSYSL